MERTRNQETTFQTLMQRTQIQETTFQSQFARIREQLERGPPLNDPRSSNREWQNGRETSPLRYTHLNFSPSSGTPGTGNQYQTPQGAGIHLSGSHQHTPIFNGSSSQGASVRENEQLPPSPPNTFGLNQAPHPNTFGSNQIPPPNPFGSNQAPPPNTLGSNQAPPPNTFGSNQAPPLNTFGSNQTPPSNTFGSNQAPPLNMFGSNQTPATAAPISNGASASLSSSIEQKLDDIDQRNMERNALTFEHMKSYVHAATSAPPDIDLVIRETRRTPFTKKIAHARVREAGKIKFPEYSGNSDPRAHVRSFMLAITKAHLTAEEEEAVFIETRATEADLWTLTQGQGEPLRSYEDRFKQIKAQIPNLNENVALRALTYGLWFSSKFKEELQLRHNSGLDDALHKANAFARTEEEYEIFEGKFNAGLLGSGSNPQKKAPRREP
ncbi:unnamed protein product [Microthlaspi erraticum]|uniref:Retrotransposon gag domain-containing protein n=1 Tax=Microthlaspi erraticum TaxID=1685480 RepID=A0A6D2IR56_9BRAS|nr:unnamed protein product [Microthlaspi erraticum]